MKLLSITSAIQIYQNIYPSTIKLSTRLARYMFNLVWACPRKFRLVSLFLLINCVPNSDKKTMGQGQEWPSVGRHGLTNISLMWSIWNNSFLNCGCRWKWRMIIAVNFQWSLGDPFASISACTLQKDIDFKLMLKMNKRGNDVNWSS